MIKQHTTNKQKRKIIKLLSIFIGMVVLVILSYVAGERVSAEQTNANSGDNVVSEPKEQTIVVPFWDSKENMHYESVEGTLVIMDNPNVYNIEMEKDGLLCLAVLIKKLDVFYPEIELKDVNGKHIKDLDYIKEGEKITNEKFPPIYLKAGTYKLEVKYYDEYYNEDYYEDEEDEEDDYESEEDFEEESTDEDNGEKKTTSKKYVLEYEILCSAVKEDVSSNWNLKKTEFCATKNKKMYYKKINIKKDGILKVYTQTISEDVLWDFLLGKKIDEEDWGTSITLCDKNKKEKGEVEFIANKEPAVFAVKRGTYYLKIEGENNWYRMWSKFKAMCCGAKIKKKAIKVTNKYKSYLLPAFEKASDSVIWFKFTVKKPKIMHFYVKFVGIGEIDDTIYKEKKEIGGGYLQNGDYGDNETSCSPNRGINAIPWEKGTYYVKVKKKDIKTHGNVQIKIR